MLTKNEVKDALRKGAPVDAPFDVRPEVRAAAIRELEKELAGKRSIVTPEAEIDPDAGV